MDLRNDGKVVSPANTPYSLPIQIPAGIFLPTIAIGACFGRADYKMRNEAMGVSV